MNIQLTSNQLSSNNVSILLKQLAKNKQIDIIDCDLVEGINSVGIATLVYIKKLYNPKFINLNQSIIELCDIYKIKL